MLLLSNIFLNISHFHLAQLPINSIQACIQKAFKDYIHQEEGYPNCSTPWNEDILKLENDANQDLKSCDRREKETQFYLDINFFKQVAENRNKKCQGI